MRNEELEIVAKSYSQTHVSKAIVRWIAILALYIMTYLLVFPYLDRWIMAAITGRPQ